MPRVTAAQLRAASPGAVLALWFELLDKDRPGKRERDVVVADPLDPTARRRLGDSRSAWRQRRRWGYMEGSGT
jgi:hypothetical protein